jgi:hypothetical protein
MRQPLKSSFQNGLNKVSGSEYVRQFAGVVFMTGSEILDWYNAVA